MGCDHSNQLQEAQAPIYIPTTSVKPTLNIQTLSRSPIIMGDAELMQQKDEMALILKQINQQNELIARLENQQSEQKLRQQREIHSLKIQQQRQVLRNTQLEKDLKKQREIEGQERQKPKQLPTKNNREEFVPIKCGRFNCQKIAVSHFWKGSFNRVFCSQACFDKFNSSLCYCGPDKR